MLSTIDVAATAKILFFIYFSKQLSGFTVHIITNVRYSGSPLPMSFAERDNKQSITEVVLKNGNVTFEKILFDTPVKLITLLNNTDIQRVTFPPQKTLKFAKKQKKFCYFC